MISCPVCGKEHQRFVYMSTHMILTAINHEGDEHERYLNLLTGKDMSFWAHQNDARIANYLKKYYQKHGHLPSLIELEEKEDSHEE